jgi:hypothetical protein
LRIFTDRGKCKLKNSCFKYKNTITQNIFLIDMACEKIHLAQLVDATFFLIACYDKILIPANFKIQPNNTTHYEKKDG